MQKDVVGYCPVCSEKLIATKLTCKNCELDLTGDFSLNKFSYLTKEEQEFLAFFLQSEGSFKDVQGKFNITFLKAKQMLSDILIKLNLKNESEGKAEMNNSVETSRIIEVNENDHFVVRLIKDKLNFNGGKATIPLISPGKEAKIWFDKNGTGLVCDKIPVPNQLTWESFIAAYNIAVAQDGKVYKGYARAGKLGSDKLPIISLEGYIAHKVHGVQKGGSAYSPGFIIAAVLDWVGVLINERGSIVTLVPGTVCVRSYEEALQNAKTFNGGLDDSIEVMNKLSYFRHWYYFDEIGGFAPSKFIGYKNMDMKAYEEGCSSELDGRDTERVLQKFFKKAEGGIKDELFIKLESFLRAYDKQPNAMAEIHTRK